MITCVTTGLCCGIVCGVACVFFAWLTTLCDDLFHSHDWLIFLLPVTGFVVVYLYDDFRRSDELSMNALYKHMREGKPLSIWIAPLVALSTCLSYLTGGSVGRVGSALQIGGGLAVFMGRKLPFLKKLSPSPELLLACGVAAGFSGILNSPLAGALFGVEVMALRGKQVLYVIPALISSFLTWGISIAFPVKYIDFHTSLSEEIFRGGGVPEDAQIIGKVLLVAVAAMLVARLYCGFRKITVKGFNLVGNKYLRVICGTVMVIALTQILGHTNANGIGFTYVDSALDGHSAMLAFLWKLMLTAFTLGCGIRGGEIAPVIFIGATSCFAVGTFIDLDPTVAAAVGIVGALSSVTNCPIAIFVYGLESICCSLEMAMYFLIAICVSYFLSGDGGLYSEQKITKRFFHISRWRDTVKL